MRLAASTPLWQAARILLIERGDAFFALLQRAPREPHRHILHDLRVASRRLREGLALFAPCYPEPQIRALRRQVRRVTRTLGEVRNADETFAYLAVLARRLGPPARRVLADPLTACRKKRREERIRLEAEFAALSGKELRRRFYRIAGRPPLFTGEPAAAFRPLGDFAREVLALDHSDIPCLLPVALRETETEAQHRLRIAVKHYRYRAEILSPLLGDGFPPLHGMLKEYQEELGRMHDLDLFIQLLPPAAETAAQAVADAIREERHRHFRNFLALHEAEPLPQVAARLRSLA